MGEIPVAVGEVDRRVLVTDIDAELGLVTCVWSRIGQMARHSTHGGVAQGFLLIPVSGVDMRKVASENRLVRRKSEEPDEMGHDFEKHVTFEP